MQRRKESGPDSVLSGSKTIELPQIYTCVTESIIWPSINLPDIESLGISDWHICNTQASLMEKVYRMEEKMIAFLQNFVSQTTI